MSSWLAPFSGPSGLTSKLVPPEPEASGSPWSTGPEEGMLTQPVSTVAIATTAATIAPRRRRWPERWRWSDIRTPLEFVRGGFQLQRRGEDRATTLAGQRESEARAMRRL